jgi:ribosome recycling factor
MEQLVSKVKDQTAKVIEALKTDLSGIRTGRANPSLIENVKVEAYGQMMTVKEVGMISTPDPKMLTVQPWDAGTMPGIIKGVRDAGLGLNPVEDSGIVRIPLPQITAERRAEFIKLVGTKSEEKRVQIRGIRREVMEGLDRDKKAGAASEDDIKRAEASVQKAIDEAMSQVDSVARAKEAELQEI